MSTSTRADAAGDEENVVGDHRVGEVTRRTALAGAAATTAAAAIGIDAPAGAQIEQPNAQQNMDTFVMLSAALTGVAKDRLSPFVDVINIKQDYFKRIVDWSAKKQSTAFASLLQITKAAALKIPDPATDPNSGGRIQQGDVDRLVKQIEAREDTKFLARSIVLMWYLGAWYEPDDLRALTQSNPPRFINYTVLSPKAYTQGWLWRVAQAHPMGYSELQFGYWNRPPQPLADFIAVRQPKGTP